jgi:hypothetical protein
MQAATPKISNTEVQKYDNIVRVCFLSPERLATEHAKEIAAGIYRDGDVLWEDLHIFHQRVGNGVEYTIDIPRAQGEEYVI